MDRNAIGFALSCHAADTDCRQSLSLINCALCAKLPRIGKVEVSARISPTAATIADIMARHPNTTSGGGCFAPATVQVVWNKGQVAPRCDPATWRKDACGARMRFSAYGSTDDHGWEVDHIRPVAKGGIDNPGTRTDRGSGGKTRAPLSLEEERQAKAENAILGAVGGGVFGFAVGEPVGSVVCSLAGGHLAGSGHPDK